MGSRRDTIFKINRGFPAISFVTASSTSSVILSSTEYSLSYFRLCPSQTCWIDVGPTPSAAVGTGMRIPQNAIIDIEVPATHLIAAIGESAAGQLSITRVG